MNKFTSLFLEELEQSISVKNLIRNDKEIYEAFSQSVAQILKCLKGGNKILLGGNGGSAADSQHFASEIISKFIKIRKHLPAIALTTDSSVITSIGNDFGFEYIFAKQIEALGNKNDIFVAFTTSCKSRNIINAIIAAKKKDMKVILFCGKKIPAKIKKNTDTILSIKSSSVPRIQENHLFIYHNICKIVDSSFY